MNGLFKPDSGLMIFMTQVTDCIFLSLFFLLGCVPVVTAGASFAALYDAVYRGFRRGEKNTWLRFLHVFRTNWKAGILPTLVFFAAVAGLGYGMIQCWNGAVYGHISWMLFAGLDDVEDHEWDDNYEDGKKNRHRPVVRPKICKELYHKV